jgi:hypothetical protein
MHEVCAWMRMAPRSSAVAEFGRAAASRATRAKMKAPKLGPNGTLEIHSVFERLPVVRTELVVIAVSRSSD